MDSKGLTRPGFHVRRERLSPLVFVLTIVVLAPTARAGEPHEKHAADSGRSSARVIFEGETLTVVNSGLGPFSAADRAEAAVERLLKVVESWELDPTQVSVSDVPAEDLTEIQVGGTVIMAVTDEDVAGSGRTRQDQANALAARLRTAVMNARVRHSSRWLVVGGLKTGLATILLVAAVVLVKVMGRHLGAKLDARGIGAGQQESMVAFLTHVLCVVSSLTLRLLTWPVAALFGLIYLHFVLDFFPSTAYLAKSFNHRLLSVLGTEMSRAVDYSPNLLVIAAIALATRCLLKVARAVLGEFERGQLRLSDFSPDWAKPTYNILRSIILALMVVVVYPYLPGSDSAAFRGVSVFLGLLLSLGSSSVIANAVAGTILTYLRAMYPGDYVQLGELTGTVVDKSLLVTRIRTIKNEMVTIPNGVALSTQVRNYSVMAQREGVILSTSLPVSYDVPWRTVHSLLQAAARETEGVLLDPPPFVLQAALTENFVRYELNVHTARPDLQPMVLSTLHQNIQDQFQEAGIAISNPTCFVLTGGESAPRTGPPLKVAT